MEPGPRGFTGQDGRSIEVSAAGDHISWRYAGDVEWNEIIAVSDLVGEKGDQGDAGVDGQDGREVELQVTGTHIQWRLTGETFVNLVSLASITGPVGPVGATGSQGVQGNVGNTGPAGLGTPTPSTPARTLNSAGFQIHATKNAYVCYTIKVVAAATVSAAQRGDVVLLCDSATTPTTARARCGSGQTIALGVAIGVTSEDIGNISTFVPAGWYVRLVSTVTGATVTIQEQTEITFG